MTKKMCRKGHKLRQLRAEEAGSRINPKRLIPFWYCSICNETYEESYFEEKENGI